MQNSRITLGHGSGGKLSHDLIESVFISQFWNDISARSDDSAVFSLGNDNGNIGDKQLAFTTDSYVVKPITWPGGDIGKLAVCGTVNDLAVVGATPLYLSAAFVIEEGLLLTTLTEVVKSMAETAAEANIKIVTG
ncbi:MAG: hydrogenase expression/formation protein HypE, partial [Chloroflexi bacterium]|nr:hydrogenase expression/formation protein HypE [Chloroflexota bacterium]